MSYKRVVTNKSSGSNEQSLLPASVPFGPPKFDIPDIPDDITIVGEPELMLLFSQFVQWQNYAATDFAQADVAESRAEAKVRYVEAVNMVGNWGGSNDKVTVARATMSTDPDVIKARNDVLTAYAKRKLVSVVYENCERCANLVSRELTRRVGGRQERVRGRHDRWNP